MWLTLSKTLPYLLYPLTVSLVLMLLGRVFLIFELTGAATRARYAAKLFRAGKADRVLISGGNLLEQSGGVEAEAHYLRMFLGELGVPSEAILLESRSRSTRENDTSHARYDRLPHRRAQ